MSACGNIQHRAVCLVPLRTGFIEHCNLLLEITENHHFSNLVTTLNLSDARNVAVAAVGCDYLLASLKMIHFDQTRIPTLYSLVRWK